MKIERDATKKIYAALVNNLLGSRATVGHSKSLLSQRKLHRNCFRFSLFLSTFPTVFFITPSSLSSNYKQSFSRLPVQFHRIPTRLPFLFLFLSGHFKSYLCLLFPIELFSNVSTSTILLFIDVSFPRFHFFTVYLLQLSLFIMAKSNKHRAAARMFQLRWEEEYFFIEFNSKYICLICKESLATSKEHNFKRHYTSFYKSYSSFSSFDSFERKKTK